MSLRVIDCWVNVNMGELLHFMNTRGRDKILFASDHPVLPMERCVREAQALDLREGVFDRLLYANAQRLFLTPRKPRYP